MTLEIEGSIYEDIPDYELGKCALCKRELNSLHEGICLDCGDLINEFDISGLT
jgi:hypothetical protein